MDKKGGPSIMTSEDIDSCLMKMGWMKEDALASDLGVLILEV